MQQYIINMLDTSDAKALLKIIIATGYFNQVKKVKTDTNEKTPNKETIEVIEAVERGKVNKYKNAKAMFNHLKETINV